LQGTAVLAAPWAEVEGITAYPTDMMHAFETIVAVAGHTASLGGNLGMIMAAGPSVGQVGGAFVGDASLWNADLRRRLKFQLECAQLETVAHPQFRFLDGDIIHVGAVGGLEVPHPDPVSFEHELTMVGGDRRIIEGDVAAVAAS